MSRKLEYTYEFVDGNSVTLTARGDCADERKLISEKWLELLEEMDHEEQLNNRRETRRHCSLERRDPNGKYLVARKGDRAAVRKILCLSKRTERGVRDMTSAARRTGGLRRQVYPKHLFTASGGPFLPC